jgi:hypothetical protein
LRKLHRASKDAARAKYGKGKDYDKKQEAYEDPNAIIDEP